MISKFGASAPNRLPIGIEPADDAPSGAPRRAAFGIGELVRHRLFPFRGVIYDVDAEFNNSDEWWEAIPEPIRPAKDQPFYHLLAENEDSAYIAYVSQQNLVHDENGEPVKHPAAAQIFEPFAGGRYTLRREHRH